jgi:zinc protease
VPPARRSLRRARRSWRPCSASSPIDRRRRGPARAPKALKDFDDTINDPQRFAVALAEANSLGDWRLFFLQRDRWRALTASDVNRVAGNTSRRRTRPWASSCPRRRPTARRRGIGRRARHVKD